MELSDGRQALKDEYINGLGHWDDGLQGLLELDPHFFAAHLALAEVPVRKGVLEPKVQQLVHFAVAANATHMYREGTRLRIRECLRSGAAPAEILEVLQLVGTLGIHAVNVGMPILDEVLRERGERAAPDPLSERQQELKKAFRSRRGFWHEDFDLFLELDPELFAAYGEFSSLPWREGGLEPKVKEFIYIAFDVAATHLHRPGIKQHMHNAMRQGATREEILAVLEITSTLGNHAALAAAPILQAELAETTEVAR